ncbi:hypothetical protein SASPL_133683 [Salvia splendens]|uniref:Uncharacterized protein n=1 Tax=Salvia splendens TaxID=180675 RepID=A0A8X8X358_SALSN|nr:hypothetical protein SASPL_133683 [Salvia splendens]
MEGLLEPEISDHALSIVTLHKMNQQVDRKLEEMDEREKRMELEEDVKILNEKMDQFMSHQYHSSSYSIVQSRCYNWKKLIEKFYGAEAPQEVDVQPPEVVSTKGCGSRLPSRVEKSLKLKRKPLRQCKKCQEWGHHDSRNCDKFKEKEKRRSRRNSEV